MSSIGLCFLFLLGTLSSLCFAEDCGGKRCDGSCCGEGLSECCQGSFPLKPFVEEKDHNLQFPSEDFQAIRRQHTIIFIVFACLGVLVFILICIFEHYYYGYDRRMIHGRPYFSYGPPPVYTTVVPPAQPQSTFATQYSTQYSDPTRYT